MLRARSVDSGAGPAWGGERSHDAGRAMAGSATKGEPMSVRETGEAGGVDLLATLKGAFAAVFAAAVLAALDLPTAWALVIGAAVIAVEKRNHTMGRRDRPAVIALAIGVVVTAAVATLAVLAA